MTKSSIIGICTVASALTVIPFTYAAKTQQHGDSVKKSSKIPEKRNYTLKKDVNPCDDFHEYVCSDVENSFQLRDDRSSHIFAFEDSDERLLEKRKAFSKKLIKRKN